MKFLKGSCGLLQEMEREEREKQAVNGTRSTRILTFSLELCISLVIS